MTAASGIDAQLERHFEGWRDGNVWHAYEIAKAGIHRTLDFALANCDDDLLDALAELVTVRLAAENRGKRTPATQQQISNLVAHIAAAMGE